MRLQLFFALFLSAPSIAQIPDAGPNFETPWPGSISLDGHVQGANGVEWFSADGNGASEDMLQRFRSGFGTESIAVLHTSGGVTLGWPGDMVRIGAQWWAVDVGQRRLYTLDPNTGLCSLIGTNPYSSTYSSVNSLAYDAAGDRLFGVDTAKKQLLKFNRTTGQVSTVGGATLTGYALVRSLAFDSSTGKLYAADASTNWLLEIDPNTGAVTPQIVLTPDPTQRTEELEFFDGRLLAVRGKLSAGILVEGQLARVDRATGTFEPIGGTMLDCSPHALVPISLPDPIQWSLVSGPGTADFADAGALDTVVEFSEAGIYELELAVLTSSGTLRDSVTVVADGCPFDPLEILPANCSSNGTSFCFGDGSGAACPCANPGGAEGGCRNSTGVGARLSNHGGSGVSADDTLFVVDRLPPGKSGLVFMGSQTVAGGVGVAFKDGLRCVGGQQKRFPVQTADATGTFHQSNAATLSNDLITVGSTWNFQAWYRDDASTCGKQSNFSNALALTFQP